MLIKAELDPLNKFEKVSKDDLADSLGYVPGWVLNDVFFEMDLKSALKEQYAFWMDIEIDGKLNKYGVFVSSFNQDSDMYPLVKIERGEETLYQYQHGIVAIVQKDGSSYITRMD